MIPVNPQDPTQELQALKNRVAALERLNKTPNGLDRYLDNKSKDIISQSLDDRIIDLVWERYIYHYDYFNSLDGWNEGGSNAAVSSGRLFLRASGSGQTAWANKRGAGQSNSFSFNNHSRFRTSITPGDALESGGDVITDIAAYFGTGYAETGVDNILVGGFDAASHYGFALNDDELYGICSDGTNYSSILLKTGIQNFYNYALEARHYPGYKVTFYVSEGESVVDGNPNTVRPMKEYASLTTTLPTGYRGATAEFVVGDTGGGDRDLDVYFAEVIQDRQPR
jgi:hypothetical protein